jgi:rhamnogalacturonan endolyase
MQNRPRVWIVCASILWLAASVSFAESPPVRLSQDDSAFTLDNGIVSARVSRRAGELIALEYQGMNLIKRGYWSQVGRADSGADVAWFGSKRSNSVSIDPAQNGGQRAEVVCRFTPENARDGLPVDVELRYTLGQGDQGLYLTEVWTHHPGQPGFRIGEARQALKLDGEIFDYLAIDAQRKRLMPSGSDWDAGQTLELKEVRKITTGPLAGTIEHKYDYSASLPQTPAFGWASTRKQVGLWLINPSAEYLSGGPTKVELTAHLDVNPGGLPTLLNMWHGSHYGGSSLVVEQDEAWTKTIGPFLLHVNHGKTPEALWAAANERAGRERDQWPYPWAIGSGEKRSMVTGKIELAEPFASGRLWVGLAPTPYKTPREETVDWQRDSKRYQFWAAALPDGSFKLTHVRAGTYSLFAIGDGILGEYRHDGVRVEPGHDLDLGRLVWKPARFGRVLWQIGTPNRSASEFRHGDDYWHWGLWRKYAEEFPNDVNFEVGTSVAARDWNYVQPPRIEGRRASPTTWTIAFDLPQSPRGRATLRLAICGSRNPRGVEVRVNDQDVGGTGPLPDTGTMHRDGITGYWVEKRLSFDAALMKAGRNTIKLAPPVTSWIQGVLYDCVRLELDEGPKPVTIVILGDSTVSNYPTANKLRGWGQVIGDRFQPQVRVENLAVSGRSTKTFINEGRLTKALAIKADYALIQFGHNDSHARERPESTDAATDFRENLRKYVDDFRAVGTRPVLVTPMHRRRFDTKGKVTRELQPYADAMKAVAAEKKVPLVDLHAASGALFESLGEKKSADFNPHDRDRTHFTEKGANAMAGLVIEALRKLGPEWGELIR